MFRTRARLISWMTWVVVASGLVLLSAPSAPRAGEPPPIPPQVLPEPVSDDDTDFKSIFDGKTLEGWDGDPVYWRVGNGAIVGETTEANVPKYNSFIIWRGGKPKDFEWKIEYRITPAGNSGLQYRSAELPEVKWILRGYQDDIGGTQVDQMFYEKYLQPKGYDYWGISGQNYEERGRTFLALPGQLSTTLPGKTQRAVASLGPRESFMGVATDDWNRAHLIVRGNLMIHILNDRVMSIVIDDDTERRTMEGALGMQVHVGPPMKVEFRNIRLKTFAASPR